MFCVAAKRRLNYKGFAMPRPGPVGKQRTFVAFVNMGLKYVCGLLKVVLFLQK